MSYVDQAAPDLAAALRGPVGKTLLAGGDGKGELALDEIVEVFGPSIIPGSGIVRRHSAAWIVLTVREKPCAVVVSTTAMAPSMSSSRNVNQRYDDIASISLLSKVTEPGRCCVMEARDPAGDPFRPFTLKAKTSCWYPESILRWGEALEESRSPNIMSRPPSAPFRPETLSAEVYAEIEQRPASPDGMVIDPFPRGSTQAAVAASLALPSMGRVLGAPMTYQINGYKVPAVRIVMRRLRRTKRSEAFTGALEVAVSRAAIRAQEADTLERVLELVPDHAAHLASCL